MSGSRAEAIRSAFEGRILSGELRPGERLPTEAAIMEVWGCSRMTVSRALSALTTAGLIERRKRAGTFVARPRVHAMVLEIPDLAADLAAQGRTHAFALTSRRVEVAEKAGRILHLSGVHHADGAPLAVEQRRINLSAVPAAEHVDFDSVAPGTWLLAAVPWTEASTRIAAAGASRSEAAVLDLHPGAPCLTLERQTWRGAATVTWVRQVFPADRYDVTARFGPA